MLKILLIIMAHFPNTSSYGEWGNKAITLYADFDPYQTSSKIES